MRTFIRQLIQTVAIVTFISAGLSLMEPVHVSAAELDTGLATVAATQPVEDDFQACATLIGEGAECGWAEFDPSQYDPITGEPITQTVAAPQDLPTPPDDGDDAGRVEEPRVPCADSPDGVAVSATLPCDVAPPPASQQVKCPVPVGEGVVCTGPEIPTDLPPQANPPVDTPVSEEPAPDEIVGTDITPDSGEEPAAPVIDAAPEETNGDEVNNDDTNSDPCENSVGEGVVSCGPEMPASGQGITLLRIFVPTVSSQQ
ncbi:MAG: hypothetical protein WDZ49_04905 [Litorilinea sp.]